MNAIERTVLAAVALGAAALTAAACGCRDVDARPPLVRGMQAYQAHCAACHGEGGGGDGPVADSLAARGVRPPSLVAADRVRALGDGGIARAIGSGAHVAGARAMPVWGAHLGTALQGDVTSYVVTLPQQSPAARAAQAGYLESPPGTAREARRTYVRFCSGCHGPEGAGDALVAPSLRERLAAPDLRDSLRFAALADQDLRDFIALRGAHAQYASVMPGWIHLLGPGDVDALVGYVRHLSRTASR